MIGQIQICSVIIGCRSKLCERTVAQWWNKSSDSLQKGQTQSFDNVCGRNVVPGLLDPFAMWPFCWNREMQGNNRGMLNVAGLRMLDQPYMTDLIEANSMGHQPDKIHIYSASWGPTDDGKTVDGPRNATMRAIVRGVNEVRMASGRITVTACFDRQVFSCMDHPWVLGTLQSARKDNSACFLCVARMETALVSSRLETTGFKPAP